jgi:hypothetical protein
MSNVFVNLPATANAVGAAVDTSAMGKKKTITVQGNFTGTLIIEISCDGGTTWAQRHLFSGTGKKVLDFAANRMRVRSSGVTLPAAFSPSIDVGANTDGGKYGTIPAPAKNAVGATLDISAFGNFTTFIVQGSFSGVIAIEISEDGTDFAECATFANPGVVCCKELVGSVVRARSRGANTSALIAHTPVVSTGATDEGLFPPERTIIVQEGGSIESGIAAALALVPPPSATAPAAVLVYPGVYGEPPLTVPEWVVVKSAAGPEATFVTSDVDNAPLFTGSDNAALQGFNIAEASAPNGAGVLMDVAGTFTVRECIVHDCETGYLASGASSVLSLVDCQATKFAAETLDNAYLAEDGALLNGNNVIAQGTVGSPITTAFTADGASSRMLLHEIEVDFAIDGLLVSNTGTLRTWSGHVFNCTNAFHIAATAGTFEIFGVEADDSGTWDLFIESASGTFIGNGNEMRQDRISVVAGSTVVSQHVSDFAGDLATIVLGELQVGMPEMPAESVFGEGDSHVRGMSVFRNTNLEVGVWSDITTEMASASGSTADAFPGTGVGNTFYIGGDLEFPGFKVDTTIAIVPGIGSLVWEFWNGAAWTGFNLMAADSVSPYDSHAQDVFSRVARCRISGVITTSPTLEQTKLHTNRTEINADAVIENFGTGELQKNLIWHRNLLEAIVGVAPQSANLDFSANITLSASNNSFRDNQVDAVGGSVEIPEGIDTSQPLSLVLTWRPTASPGNVEFETITALRQVGQLLNGAAAETLINTIAAAPTTNQIEQTTVDFDISSLEPGDILAIRIGRDATGGNPDDTMAGDVHLISTDLVGTFWR